MHGYELQIHIQKKKAPLYNQSFFSLKPGIPQSFILRTQTPQARKTCLLKEGAMKTEFLLLKLKKSGG